MFSDLFEQVPYVYMFVAAVFFLAGIYFAPSVVEKEIRWLLVYPLWMARLMEKYFKARWNFLILFLIILTLNNISLFSGVLSGFIVGLPLLGVFLTGFNVAVISYDMMGWQGVWQILVNPVAWLEFPASWISYGMAFHLNVVFLQTGSFHQTYLVFREMLPLYAKYVATLLLIAALLESFLIRLADKYLPKDGEK